MAETIIIDKNTEILIDVIVSGTSTYLVTLNPVKGKTKKRNLLSFNDILKEKDIIGLRLNEDDTVKILFKGLDSVSPERKNLFVLIAEKKENNTHLGYLISDIFGKMQMVQKSDLSVLSRVIGFGNIYLNDKGEPVMYDKSNIPVMKIEDSKELKIAKIKNFIEVLKTGSFDIVTGQIPTHRQSVRAYVFTAAGKTVKIESSPGSESYNKMLFRMLNLRNAALEDKTYMNPSNGIYGSYTGIACKDKYLSLTDLKNEDIDYRFNSIYHDYKTEKVAALQLYCKEYNCIIYLKENWEIVKIVF